MYIDHVRHDKISTNDLAQQGMISTSIDDTTTDTPCMSTVNDRLLVQLITESAKVKEQRQTIDQLEREKSDLKERIQLLEQQTTRRC
jgi:predicted nuclease with TOPRIM domain